LVGLFGEAPAGGAKRSEKSGNPRFITKLMLRINSAINLTSRGLYDIGI
jgi:hypothetical protein